MGEGGSEGTPLSNREFFAILSPSILFLFFNIYSAISETWIYDSGYSGLGHSYLVWISENTLQKAVGFILSTCIALPVLFLGTAGLFGAIKGVFFPNFSSRKKWKGYQGETNDKSIPHGQGFHTFPNGSTYEGEWKEGKRHGKGKWRDVNGAYAEGEFVNDILFDGRIKMAEEEDGYIEGLMTNGLPTGEVRVVLFESVDYRGEVDKNFRYHGHGLIRYLGDQENGRDFAGCEYEGEFKNGKKSGRGIYRWPDGLVYEGEFYNDWINGSGTLELPGAVFEGTWVDGARNGPGVDIFDDGGRFEGEYVKGKRSGHGIETFSDGSSKEGVWKDLDLLHGKMIEVGQEEGFRFEVTIQNHQEVSCSILLPDGTLYEGSKEGELFKGTKISTDGTRNQEEWEWGFWNALQDTDSTVIPELAALQKKVELARLADTNRTTNPSTGSLNDVEELAKLTGRKVEDVVADLADDGILNLSAGSDTVHESEDLIDPRRFVRVRKLRAEGGMAEVYQGLDKQTGEHIIWKQAAPSRKLSAKEANRALANEVEVLERLDHPRIPNYIDSGYTMNEEGDRVLVLIMQHIDGGSLDDEMKTFVRRGKTQDLEYVIETVVQCCEALEYMADLDPPLYHRDIKPHNIMTHPERGVVLIDFGLAKEVAAGSGHSLSGGGHTAGWSPPERERSITGPTTDVYGLGQVLWHMLTNERAGIFSEDFKSQRIVESGHPEWLVDVVNSATVPDDPDKRIQSIAELRIRLENGGELP